MNLTEILLHQMHARPDALAVRYAREYLSYSSLGVRVLRAAGGLKTCGVSKGDVVAIALSDPLAHLTASLALAHLGATSISVAHTTPAPRQEFLFGQTNCCALISDEISPRLKTVQNLRMMRWADIASHEGMASEIPEALSDDHYWTFVMGSGSTGRAKIMPVTHGQQIRRAKLGSNWLPYSSDDVLLSLVSMHFYAAKQRALEAISLGAGLYLDAPGCIDHRDAVARGEVTAIYATVVHIERLLRFLPVQSARHYESLRALMIGGSSVSMELRDRIRARLTSKLYVLWGTNETNTSTITDVSSVYRTNGTVGRAFPSVKIEVVDNLGQPVSPGMQGLIRVSSPTMIHGYLNDPEATRKAFKDCWFYTGDVGYISQQHELVHLGRADDMMNVGGVNLFPSEIEKCLQLLPNVVDAVAFPLRDTSTGQDIPVALVEAERGTTLEPKKLIGQVRASIGTHALYDLRVVGTIPRNEQGKVQRDQLNQIIKKIWGKQDYWGAIASTLESPSSRVNKNAITIFFNRPENVELMALTGWLALLDETVLTSQDSHLAGNIQTADSIWLEHVLALARGFLNILGVPLFDPIRIIDCHPSKALAHSSEANICLPDASLVPGPLMVAVLNVALEQAVWLAKADVTSVMDREQFFSVVKKKILQDLSKFAPSGKSTFQILRVAHQMGIAYRKLPGGAYQLGWGHNARRIDRSTTDRDSALGSKWTRDKLLTAQLLRAAGLPTPNHKRASGLSEAQAIAAELGFPVVVKPSDCERGEGVEVDVGPESLQNAFETAMRLSPRKTVLVERQVAGVCHRLFIVDGKLLYAVKRLPIGVYADGKTSIVNIVDREMKIQASIPSWKRSGIQNIDEMAVQMLKRQGWTPDSVPPARAFVALRRIETTALGGIDEEVTSIVHTDNLKAAVTATQLLGLEVAGVDIITTDISQPWHETGAIINEVNYAPLLGGGEISRRYIEQYLDTILNNRGRIPIHVYLGGKQAWAKGHSHHKDLCRKGLVAYLTNDDRTIDASGAETYLIGRGLREKINALLLRQEVQALIIVVQSVPCLHDVRILDHVMSFDVVDMHPEQALRNPNKIPLNVVSTMIQLRRTQWTKLTSSNNYHAASFKDFMR